MDDVVIPQICASPQNEEKSFLHDSPLTYLIDNYYSESVSTSSRVSVQGVDILDNDELYDTGVLTEHTDSQAVHWIDDICDILEP